jgi:hypothetical protein
MLKLCVIGNECTALETGNENVSNEVGRPTNIATGATAAAATAAAATAAAVWLTQETRVPATLYASLSVLARACWAQAGAGTRPPIRPCLNRDT